MSVQIPSKMIVCLSKDADYYANVTRLASNVADFYSLSPEFFPDYTIHGIKHVNAVLELADKLITPSTMEFLTARDLSILISSIIIHDLGMFLTIDGVQKLLFSEWCNNRIDGLDERSWADEWKEYLEQVRRYPDEKMQYSFGECVSVDTLCLDRDKMIRKDILVVGEFLRQQHPRLAHEIAETSFMGSVDNDVFAGTSFGEDDRRLIGLIARSHGMEIRETENYIRAEFADENNPCGTPAFYLMAILRIADYLDAGEHRAPKQLTDRQAINVPISLQEWRWNGLINIDNYSWKEEEHNLYIQASPKDSTDFILVEKWLKKVQYELDMCWSILAEKYAASNYRLSIHRIQSNILNPKTKAALNRKFLTKEAKLDANPELLKLLIHPLYGDDPSFGIRELIQNSVDACVEREHLEPGFLGKVTISIDTKNHTFTICDNGIGMNEDVLLNYYLTAGASYRFSEDWAKDFITEDKAEVARTGKFGVGVLSTFLIGSPIHVKTRYLRDDLGYEFEFQLEPKLIDIRRVKCEIGTTITVKLTDLIVEKLVKAVKEMYSYREVKWYQWYALRNPAVVYYVDGNQLESNVKYVPNNQDNDSDWYRFKSSQYDAFFWKYDYEDNNYCNGIVIPKCKEYKIGTELGMDIISPKFAVTDTHCNLRVDLARSMALEFPDQERFSQEAYKYLLAKLLTVDWSTIEAASDNILQGFRYDRPRYFYEPTFRYLLSKDGYTLHSSPFICAAKPGHILLVSYNRGTSDDTLNNLQANAPLCLFPAKNKRQSIDFYRSVLNADVIKPKTWLPYYKTSTAIMRLWADIKGFDEVGDKMRKSFFKETKTIPTHQEYYRFDSLFLHPEDTIPVVETDLDPKRFPIVAEYWIETENSLENNYFLNMLSEYLGDNIWIPYDMEERKKKFPNAFEQLAYYIECFEKQKPCSE